ncbi:MAG: hypothetical protein WC686_03800 [Candidatus Shapirobacteria bacterium]
MSVDTLKGPENPPPFSSEASAVAAAFTTFFKADNSSTKIFASRGLAPMQTLIAQACQLVMSGKPKDDLDPYWLGVDHFIERVPPGQAKTVFAKEFPSDPASGLARPKNVCSMRFSQTDGRPSVEINVEDKSLNLIPPLPGVAGTIWDLTVALEPFQLIYNYEPSDRWSKREEHAFTY